MVDETPAERGRHRQVEVENKARLQLALSKISGTADDFGAKLAQSLDVVRRALDEFEGGTGKGLAVSFNGGKDACVVLYLLLFVLAERDELWRVHSSTTRNKRIPVVYFEKEEFPEIEAFMHEVSETYGFEFQRYAKSYKDGMQDLVDSLGIKGVIMGQRRGDPWTESMHFFTSSTPGWAKFTRVNPALEWKFCHVWRLLRGSGLPYCVLYDQGYTSLGERGDTAKNEALRLPDGRYRPAYELAAEEEHLERSPRTSTVSPSPRSPASDRGGDGGEGGEGGGGGSRRQAGGDDGGGEKNKRFSSWDKEWESLDARDVGTAAAAVASGAGAGGVVSTGTTGTSAASAQAGGACAKSTALELSSTNKACLQPDGKVCGGGWRGLAGLVAWLPVTTVALALVLAAVGLRSSSGSSRGAEHDSAADKGD